MSRRVLMPAFKLCIVSLVTSKSMATRTLKLLMGAALLTTLAACQGNTPKASSEPAMSHGDTEEMMSGEHDHDHTAMGDPIFSGAFQKGEADAAGTFKIYKHGDAAMVHLSEDFATNTGAPDLYLVIGNTANPIADKEFPYPLDESEYVTVAALDSATGAQDYELPADIDLSEDNSVVVWCKKFNATMSYAPLEVVQ
ncbi:MAG: DM13 domain-containing protein [Synechococcus sp. SB0668_bin_15]|nr:DM13 domain-containing protein [Synechococcus sp. SB0668_bin_15]MXZ82984.1 DM13 domain-containing protein [Synechococcus sp. SB0666_bin_14]MYC49137.1 DM13 domain-containing protein [Synechococcus sp. SB0662_bin_14]MYG47013.1 DM13 domain-containing protein [Synechococcus sp. SB0675_bin_6]MYJ59863.1 DM13 domain-containing protein [Synechococcus sp. SB0672_bin_6]MYK91616.1 DM13 domain-containing protein [Synechococcus sp. SB0669_bin_8]